MTMMRALGRLATGLFQRRERRRYPAQGRTLGRHRRQPVKPVGNRVPFRVVAPPHRPIAPGIRRGPAAQTQAWWRSNPVKLPIVKIAPP
jgi:hypothetical protein